MIFTKMPTLRLAPPNRSAYVRTIRYINDFSKTTQPYHMNRKENKDYGRKL